MKTKQKRIQDDSVVVTCPKCGHKHSFISLKALDKMPTSTSCAGCGFLFLQHLAIKMDATLTLLKSESKTVALLRDSKVEDFEKISQEEDRIVGNRKLCAIQKCAQQPLARDSALRASANRWQSEIWVPSLLGSRFECRAARVKPAVMYKITNQ